MTNTTLTPGVVPGRLPPEAYAANFADVAPPLDAHEAKVAADRCYFCYDAPCITACPTSIDIPLFIRQIQSGTPDAAGMTIFHSNIFGGMCARVCPVENLCEGACVRLEAEGEPVEIGALQRYATDDIIASGIHPFRRGPATGLRIAVVGAGPAGLSCAHRLAAKGHDVVVFDAHAKPGGLNEYGIASYKAVDGFAAAEVEWLLGIGGIELRQGQALGRDVTLEALRGEFDAVFLGMGLAGVNQLGFDAPHVRDAVDFIAELRQTPDLSTLPVGRDVVVIGGGMTAVDAAVQAKGLGAQSVTIAYRRGPERMGASRHEQDHAATSGVRIVTNAAPKAVGADGAVEFTWTRDLPDSVMMNTGETTRIAADQVLVAIGQRLGAMPEGLEIEGGRIAVRGAGRTSVPNVWAGGDCATGGDELTVTAVAQGRDAAEDIHELLTGDAPVDAPRVVMAVGAAG
ncbi:FAD-dependent oxidoreductase [Paracoccus sp. S-4012]|uniref:NAD(P)-dependent oxidoreductase n=1 Tax=Paracoccus sp. S-4012 TaxID=2665648 RepID=UPI0012AFDCB0|nr:NAD(P)-dependent oxidoreductase [Paracoccus sp. S-4012]MRX51220.1 FAD-dependent oxidoreductase [Paracoccus sp. S-4012]